MLNHFAIGLRIIEKDSHSCEPFKDHMSDCYFCAVNVKDMNRFKRRQWEPQGEQLSGINPKHAKKL